MIRRFDNKDLDAVMKIWLFGNFETHHFVDSRYWVQNYSTVSEMILAADVYVYEENDIVIGFVGLTDNYIAGIFVQKDYQSCGIGKKLLGFLKSMYSELTLDVYQKNSRALAFYVREDFEIIGEKYDKNTGESEFRLQWRRI